MGAVGVHGGDSPGPGLVGLCWVQTVNVAAWFDIVLYGWRLRSVTHWAGSSLWLNKLVSEIDKKNTYVVFI